eukprot:2195819-Prymnesium_polylepis.1
MSVRRLRTWIPSRIWPRAHGVRPHGSALAMCGPSALPPLAFALGAVHFLCSPAAEGSRLKAVTMAATGHMHGVTKLLYRWCAGGHTLRSQQRRGGHAVFEVVLGTQTDVGTRKVSDWKD